MENPTGPLVLIVDDEAPIRQMERRILQKGGYSTQKLLDEISRLLTNAAELARDI